MLITRKVQYSLTRRGFSTKLAAVGMVVISALTCWAQTPQENAATGPSVRRDPAFLEAERLFAQGRSAEAESKTREQLKFNPASVEGYNLLGVIYSSAKEYPKALDAFQHALRIDPSSTKVHNNLGNLFASEGKSELAEQEFRKVLRLAPADRDANYNLGLLLLAKGSPRQAITHLSRVRPVDMATRFSLVRAYLEAGRVREALKTADELSAEKKSDVQLHFTLGVLLAEEKQYRAAQAELEKANALEPESFEILYNLGQAYLRGGEYSKAELVFGRALRLKPESPETLYRLAQVYSEQSRPVDALELLVRAHKLAPADTDIIFLMARVSMSQNYFEDAIPLLESGLKLAPQRADLHAALGESYFMSGKTEKAIQEFGRLLELEPSARSYAFMGLANRHLGRFEEARKYFEEGRRRDPHNPACLFNLGFIEERQGNSARAEQLFQETLRYSPDFADALLEMANLRNKDKRFAEAAELLRKYVKVSRDPVAGYYKLAMVERSLHQTAAAQRDLNVFQTLSKNASTGPYPYQHLFDYLDNRSTLTAAERNQLDVSELSEQIKKHPGQPQDLYLLAEAYLKLGKKTEAQQAISELDQISTNDYRTQTGIGVLLARYRLYDDAIQHFRAALNANPDSDDVKFDLANGYFRKGMYAEALDIAEKLSASGQQDDSYLALLGDIYAHLGNQARSVEIFQDAIRRNPDNDQYYLSLTLIQLRASDIDGADETLKKGLARVPGSGKILWGLGLLSVLRGNAAEAADRLERAVDLLPEWAGSYSTLGVFYYETGQIDKAREVLSRFKGANLGGLDVTRIEEALSSASNASSVPGGTIPVVARQQLLQIALQIADRTL